MVNKVQFNNLVVSNKKGIQQSRLQTINKLVHKIRKLNTLLEKRPNDDKCKERIRKSTETLEYLKKFNRTEMMKNILLMQKPPAAVITNGLSTPEEICTALLAMNKIMDGLIKRFKNELKISEATDNKWRDVLKEASKRKQKIARTEEKKRKRAQLKEQKTMERKRKEWLEQNCDEQKAVSDLESAANVSTLGAWQIEELENENVGHKNVTTETKDKGKAASETHKPKNIKKTIQKNLPEPKKLTKELPKAIIQSDLYEDDKQTSDVPEIVKDEIDSDENNDQEQMVDPFFFTETGENYLASAVKNASNKSQNSAGDPDDEQISKSNDSKSNANWVNRSSKYERNNYHQNPRKAMLNNDKDSNNKHPQYSRNRNFGYNDKPQQYGTQNKWQSQNNKYENNKNKNQYKQKFTQPSKQSDNLQPSWSSNSRKRENTNMRFDDHSKKISRNERDMQKNASAQKKDDTASLHPSWAAKQKQKPVITAFEGKKITFDDE